MAEDRNGAEDAGVLGNLPRTRPGRRSDKRAAGRPAEAAGAAARKAEAGHGAAARTPRPKRAATQRETAPQPPPEPHRGGPIDDALHTVGKVAGTGIRIADGLAREVLRRLPRP
jgi:hypothetical protein